MDLIKTVEDYDMVCFYISTSLNRFLMLSHHRKSKKKASVSTHILACSVVNIYLSNTQIIIARKREFSIKLPSRSPTNMLQQKIQVWLNPRYHCSSLLINRIIKKDFANDATQHNTIWFELKLKYIHDPVICQTEGQVNRAWKCMYRPVVLLECTVKY